MVSHSVIIEMFLHMPVRKFAHNMVGHLLKASRYCAIIMVLNRFFLQVVLLEIV